jgi:hypothetical protein
MEFSEVRHSPTPMRGISRSLTPLIARYYRQVAWGWDGEGLRAMGRSKAKGRSQAGQEAPTLMIEAGATSTAPFRDRDIGCACPTGDSHARTTRGPAQRRGGAKGKPRQGWGPKKRGQGHYRGRGPVGHRPCLLIIPSRAAPARLPSVS